MPVAIEFFLDEPSAGVVRQIWREIAEAGVSPYLHTSGVRPHLTLAVGESVDGPAAEVAMREWAAARPPGSTTFNNVGVTSSEFANVFLPAIVTADLLALHAELHRKVAGLFNAPSERYLPGRWTPHCTLVERVPSELLGKTFAIIRKTQLPLEAHFSEVGLVDFSPLRQRCAVPLTG
jgi:2'-5' RNA ligase